MNRLQKKCILGTVGIHLLLLLILLVGPAFFNREPKVDNSPILEMIPSDLVDANVNSGVQNAHPVTAPAPAPQPPKQQPLPPMPPLPARNFQPPPPAPAPTPSLLERVEKYFTPKPTVTPVEKQTKPQPDNIKVDTHLVKRTAPKSTSQPNNSRAVNNAIRNLEKNLSPGTSVEMPGNSSASYASYASVVKSVYEQALRPNLPDQVASNNENTKVEITVASDGTVISAHIVSPSGDSAWDAAVQRTLDQVTTIAPFPDGATDKERHYTLSFNPEVEKSFE
jgi:periplasmic protein TonB